MTGTDRVEKSQTEVLIALDTGRRMPDAGCRMPTIVEITIPGNQPRLLPDVTQLVRCLHIVR